MNLNKFTRLKAATARYQQEIDRAAGAEEQLMKRLKKEFNVNTLKAAVALQKKLSKRRQKQERELAAGLAAFEKEYGSLLQQTEDEQ